MRLIFTILAAISLLLLLFFAFGWAMVTREVHRMSTTAGGTMLDHGGITIEIAGFSAPLWAAATIASLLPAAWLIDFTRRYIRAHRQIPGHCPACGYDLRASSERCPECGRMIESVDEQNRSE